MGFALLVALCMALCQSLRESGEQGRIDLVLVSLIFVVFLAIILGAHHACSRCIQAYLSTKFSILDTRVYTRVHHRRSTI